VVTNLAVVSDLAVAETRAEDREVAVDMVTVLGRGTAPGKAMARAVVLVAVVASRVLALAAVVDLVETSHRVRAVAPPAWMVGMLIARMLGEAMHTSREIITEITRPIGGTI
jgi:hypothetical protein